MGTTAGDETTAGIGPDGHRYTDVGNADRLIEVLDGEARYVREWNAWIVHRRGRWYIDRREAHITERAKDVAKSLFGLLPTITDPDEQNDVFQWAMQSESAGRIAAMIKLAREIDEVGISHEDLDADHMILNVKNGTIDLRTGELHPHDPDDLCTQQIDIKYDPDAQAPLWDACLARWQPSPEMRDYLQLEAGAGTTGKATRTLSVHWGTGANGKSKFWEACQRTLGPYATTPHKSLLVAQRHEQHETVKADMFRIRLAVAGESKSADVLDDEQVKSITGQDRLRARKMRQDPWFFWPTHTIVMFSNYAPRIKGQDQAIWDRVRLIPWDVRIPDDEQDKFLGERLAEEAPGILAWMVRGAVRFLEADAKLEAPSVVKLATAEYRKHEDTLVQFAEQCLVLGGDEHTTSEQLNTELEQWALDLGIEQPTPNELAEYLKRIGCTNKRARRDGKRETWWNGVSVTDEREMPSDQQVLEGVHPVHPSPVDRSRTRGSEVDGQGVAGVDSSVDRRAVEDVEGTLTADEEAVNTEATE